MFLFLREKGESEVCCKKNKRGGETNRSSRLFSTLMLMMASLNFAPFCSLLSFVCAAIFEWKLLVRRRGRGNSVCAWGIFCHFRLECKLRDEFETPRNRHSIFSCHRVWEKTQSQEKPNFSLSLHQWDDSAYFSKLLFFPLAAIFFWYSFPFPGRGK